MDFLNRCFTCLLYTFFLTFSLHLYASDLYTFDWSTTRNFVSGTIHATGSYQNLSGTVIQKSAKFKIENDLKLKIYQTYFNRILYNTGRGGSWSAAATPDILRELQSQDWIVDYDSKRIYKLDMDLDGDSCNIKNDTNKIVDYTHNIIGSSLYACPKPAAIAVANVVQSQNPSYGSLTFVSFESGTTVPYTRAYFTYYDEYGIKRNYYITLSSPERAGQTEKDAKKVDIEPSQLYDIVAMFKTSLEDSMLAANQFERTNNNSYKYLIDRLEGGFTDSSDTTIKPNPPDLTDPDNPNTNTGFSLPSFCSWATTVCDFFNWVKESPDSAVNDPVDITNSDYGHYYTEYFPWTAQCPRPVVIDADIDLIFHVEHFYYEYDYSFLCEFLFKISNYIIFAAYIGCAFIIGGVKNG